MFVAINTPWPKLIDTFFNWYSLIARFMGPTWGPSGAERTQVGPMVAPWTLLSGLICIQLTKVLYVGGVLMDINIAYTAIHMTFTNYSCPGMTLADYKETNDMRSIDRLMALNDASTSCVTTIMPYAKRCISLAPQRSDIPVTRH